MENMIYSDDLLQQVKTLAALPSYTPAAIARALEIPEDEFYIPGAILDAYDSGKLQTDIEFDTKLMQLSNQGSGPAQSLMSKLILNKKVNEIREYYG